MHSWDTVLGRIPILSGLEVSKERTVSYKYMNHNAGMRVCPVCVSLMLLRHSFDLQVLVAI